MARAVLICCAAVVACAPSSELGGVDLSSAESVVFHESGGRTMLAMTNLLEPCRHFKSIHPPAGQWWIVTAWSEELTTLDTVSDATGFAAISDGAFVAEHVAGSGTITLSAYADDALEAEVSLMFDDGDRYLEDVTAERCDADMFRGM